MNLILFALQEDGSTSPPIDKELYAIASHASQSLSQQNLGPPNMTQKKDSGYGSQGLLRLENVRLPDAGILRNLNKISKTKHSSDRSDTSDNSSQSSGISTPAIPVIIIPKEEKDLKEFYERLNLNE